MADTGSNGAGSGRSAQNASFADTSFLYGGNATYVAQLQDAYEQNPASVDPQWRGVVPHIAWLAPGRAPEFVSGAPDAATLARWWGR